MFPVVRSNPNVNNNTTSNRAIPDVATTTSRPASASLPDIASFTRRLRDLERSLVDTNEELRTVKRDYQLLRQDYEELQARTTGNIDHEDKKHGFPGTEDDLKILHVSILVFVVFFRYLHLVFRA